MRKKNGELAHINVTLLQDLENKLPFRESIYPIGFVLATARQGMKFERRSKNQPKLATLRNRFRTDGRAGEQTGTKF